MHVIGLVGGIGCGKTEVLRLLAELGAVTVAADELSREVLAPGQPALEQVRQAFGAQYFDCEGRLLRPRLGALIFADEAARQRLDGIMHPAMTALLEARLAQWRAEGRAVAAVEAAVLEEMGALPLVDTVLLVTAPAEARLGRLQARDGLTAEQARERLAAHQRLGLDTPAADEVICNAGDLGALKNEVELFWRRRVL